MTVGPQVEPSLGLEFVAALFTNRQTPQKPRHNLSNIAARQWSNVCTAAGRDVERVFMGTTRTGLSRTAWSLLVVGVALGSTCAAAAEKDSAATARYQRERAVCMSGQSNQDRATCLREAGAAFAQARHEGLSDGPPAPYARNARQRCEGLPQDDRHGCLARMQGQGTTSGTAASGGIYRELVTREVAPSSTAVPLSLPPGEPAK